jgi:hypothetical protein
MPHPIQGNRLVLKILDQSAFEIEILITLKQDVQRFDDHLAKAFIGGGQIAGHVNLGIAAATETVFDVVTAVNPALEKL